MSDPNKPEAPPLEAIHLARTALGDLEISVHMARIELRRLEKRADALLISDPVLRQVLIDWEAISREQQSMPGRERLYGRMSNDEIESHWAKLCDQRHMIEVRLHAIAGELLEAQKRAADANEPTVDVLTQIIRGSAA